MSTGESILLFVLSLVVIYLFSVIHQITETLKHINSSISSIIEILQMQRKLREQLHREREGL